MVDWYEVEAGPAAMTRQADVLRELRRRLDDGELSPGDRLPPERSLAEEFGVGRAALRRALAVLEAEGRIWRGVGRGTFVHGHAASAPDRIPDMAGLTSPAEVMEVRLALEPALARLAAHRASGRELDEVERCSDKAAAARSQATYERWDGRMHHAVAAAAHNRLFLALFEAVNAVRDHTSWGRAREARRAPGWHERTRRQHAAIVAALRARDAAAAERCMTDHLRAVRDHLLGATPEAAAGVGEGT